HSAFPYTTLFRSEVRMTDASSILCAASRPAPLVQNLHDFGCHQAFRLTEIRIGIAEIAENIAAAVDDVEVIIIGHFRASFSLIRRARTRSISAKSVLRPLRDFF